MRELSYGQTSIQRAGGDSLRCVYEILVCTMPPPLCCESYGIRITVAETGERAEVLNLTVSPKRIEALAALLLQGQVTPCALRDVVDDWL